MCGAADSWWPSRGGREGGSKQIGRAARGIQGSGCQFQGMAGKRARQQLSEINFRKKMRPQTAIVSL